jgi:hypothetical protein
MLEDRAWEVSLSNIFLETSELMITTKAKGWQNGIERAEKRVYVLEPV